MLRLLAIEFHKFKYNSASKILTLIYFALLTSIALIAAVKFDIGVIKFHLADMGIFNFPYIWHFNTYMASLFKFFLLLVIVSMISNEYSYKTLKQNLIDGLSKKEFILSKFYTVIVLVVLGFIYSDYNELTIITSDLEYLVGFFIKLVGFFSFGLFFGFLVKRSAFAVGAMFVWLILESIFKGFLFYVFRGSESISASVDQIMRFLPFEAMSNLIKEPFTRLGAVRSVATSVGEQINKSYDVEFLNIIIVIAWTYIFIYGSYALLKKRDL